MESTPPPSSPPSFGPVHSTPDAPPGTFRKSPFVIAMPSILQTVPTPRCTWRGRRVCWVMCGLTTGRHGPDHCQLLPGSQLRARAATTEEEREDERLDPNAAGPRGADRTRTCTPPPLRPSGAGQKQPRGFPNGRNLWHFLYLLPPPPPSFPHHSHPHVMCPFWANSVLGADPPPASQTSEAAD